MCKHKCKPVMLPPQYCVHDYYTQRTVTYIQPIVHINRENIVNVPEYIEEPITRNVVVDPGCPNRDSKCSKHHK